MHALGNLNRAQQLLLCFYYVTSILSGSEYCGKILLHCFYIVSASISTLFYACIWIAVTFVSSYIRK